MWRGLHSWSSLNDFLFHHQVTTFGGKNPGFRMFEVDSQTYDIVDYHQYRTDLEKQNILHNQSPDVVPQFQLAYSAKKAFGLTDMSASQWYALSQRFLQDDDLYRFYLIQHNSGRGNGDFTPASRKSDVCGMLYGFTSDQHTKKC